MSDERFGDFAKKQTPESKYLAVTVIVALIFLLSFANLWNASHVGVHRVLTEPLYLMFFGEAEIAEVTSCVEKRGGFEGASRGGATSAVMSIYLPIAKSPNGKRAEGTYLFTLANPKWCSALIGQEVNTYHYKDNSSVGRIVNFSHFWAGPMHLFFLIIWLFARVIKVPKTRYIFVVGLVVFGGMWAFG